MLEVTSTFSVPILTIANIVTKNAWDECHSLKYCQKKVTKISSLLQMVHKNEIEVYQVLQMQKGFI